MAGRYSGTNPDYDEPAREGDAFDSGAVVPKRSGIESGRARLTLSAPLATRPTQWTQLVRWYEEDQFARPVGVLVDVKSADAAATWSAVQRLFFAQADGAGVSATPSFYGVLRFTFGAGNAVRVIEADLKSGSYQLPPCTTCTVEAMIFGAVVSVDVSASIVPSINPVPTRLTNTSRFVIDAGATQVVQIPPSAGSVSLMGGANQYPAVGSGQPALTLGVGSGPHLIQDWASGTFVAAPGQFVELSSRGSLTLKNIGAVQAIAMVRFGIEL